MIWLFPAQETLLWPDTGHASGSRTILGRRPLGFADLATARDVLLSRVMENTQAPVLSFTDESKPLVYEVLVDFHADVKKLLTRAKISAAEIAQVQRRTKRAVLALGQACGGYRSDHHRHLADSALISCLSLLHLLRAEGRLAAPAYDEAYRQIQRIRVGLEVLASTPNADWPTAIVPPFPSPPSVEGDAPPESASPGTEMSAASPTEERGTELDRPAANDDGDAGKDDAAASPRGRPEAA